jgi:hypothetical protein
MCSSGTEDHYHGDPSGSYKPIRLRTSSLLFHVRWPTREKRSKIEQCIASEAAMKEKLHDFSLNHGGTPEENHAIEDAANALNVLKREVVVWRERHAS